MSLNSKSEVRSFYRELRKNFSPEYKAKMDAEIAQSFLSLDIYKNCRTLLVFVSKDIEVSTYRIISQALSDGKAVAVPRCGTENHTISFYVIESFDDLADGYFDIPEPKAYCRKLSDYDNSICIVPALAYDMRCYRTGYGGGYYDRFLNKYSGASVGLCYSQCVARELPTDEYDRPVDILITDINTVFK